MIRRAILPLICAAAPVVEVIPPLPAPGYVWQPGDWRWDGIQYVRVPGTYVAASYPGAVPVAGRWVARPHGWGWVAGHWRR